MSPADPPALEIARAEQRLAMLRRLADLGMQVAEDLAKRAVSAAQDAEPRHDPAESFARASRAVRLTLALEVRFEQELAALIAGAKAAAAAPHGDPLPEPPRGLSRRLDPRDHATAHRNRVRDNVWDVMNHEITDVFRAHEALDDLHERLAEGDRYDSLLYRPLRESVEAICKDLGFNPDWSRWTEDGFSPETRTTRRHWPSFWSPDPERARARRLASPAANPPGAPPVAPPPDPHRRQ